MFLPFVASVCCPCRKHNTLAGTGWSFDSSVSSFRTRDSKFLLVIVQRKRPLLLLTGKRLFQPTAKIVCNVIAHKLGGAALAFWKKRCNVPGRHILGPGDRVILRALSHPFVFLSERSEDALDFSARGERKNKPGGDDRAAGPSIKARTNTARKSLSHTAGSC